MYISWVGEVSICLNQHVTNTSFKGKHTGYSVKVSDMILIQRCYSLASLKVATRDRANKLQVMTHIFSIA